jgi:hypothetical protein
MSRADYAHWNEEADLVWWAEEGRHVEDEPVAYDDDWYSDAHEAENAAYEDAAEMDTEVILASLCDADYRVRWPQMVIVLEHELAERWAHA